MFVNKPANGATGGNRKQFHFWLEGDGDTGRVSSRFQREEPRPSPTSAGGFKRIFWFREFSANCRSKKKFPSVQEIILTEEEAFGSSCLPLCCRKPMSFHWLPSFPLLSRVDLRIVVPFLFFPYVLQLICIFYFVHENMLTRVPLGWFVFISITYNPPSCPKHLQQETTLKIKSKVKEDKEGGRFSVDACLCSFM